MSKAKTTANHKFPSVLAFEKNVVNSDALLSEGAWGGEKWRPLTLSEKSVRGTKSNQLKAADMNKDDAIKANAAQPNLQRVDVCSLSRDCDTIKHEFTIKFLDGISTPAACNNHEFAAVLKAKVDEYFGEFGVNSIATAYARNIASARFLFNNRKGADEVKVEVKLGDKTFVFNALEFSLRETNTTKDVEELGKAIAKGFTNGHTTVEVTTYVRKIWGQPVYPSEKLTTEKPSKKNEYPKSRVYHSSNGQAAMTSQKIGNALRTIDIWHQNFDEVGAIATGTYGAVTQKGRVHRGAKDNFYILLLNWVNGKKSEPNDKHYVVAMLVAGGVFGETKE